MNIDDLTGNQRIIAEQVIDIVSEYLVQREKHKEGDFLPSLKKPAKQRTNYSLSTSFYDDLGWDSLDIAELVMEFEDCFDLEIPDNHISSLTTIRDVIQYITKLKKQNSQTGYQSSD